ncbi:MAG TPA: SET domain-containing protein-lysine N-methyltransferase [Bacteroidetes bacterium]|nr:SET domain-containing protein-lysine N-methyltransferase [Bacteroidota bacterium]
MILVKTTLKESKIEGIGLFADEFIPKDTWIWRYQSGFDLEVKPAELENLSKEALKQFEKYAYLSRKSQNYILCFDDARFFNHSKNPNVSCLFDPDLNDEDICYATRDILKGEELTCNYRDFDAGESEDFI